MNESWVPLHLALIMLVFLIMVCAFAVGGFIYAKDPSQKIVVCFTGLFFFVLIGGIIVLFIKDYKESKIEEELERKRMEMEEEWDRFIDWVRKERIKIELEKMRREVSYCAYCGARLPKNAERCPNCGAPVMKS